MKRILFYWEIKENSTLSGAALYLFPHQVALLVNWMTNPLRRVVSNHHQHLVGTIQIKGVKVN